MENVDVKEALLLLESLDDNASEDEIDEFVMCNERNELLTEAWFMGASNKKEFKMYLLNLQNPSSQNSSRREHRMRCNVCGHIFCYTDEDVKKNAGNAGMGALTALGGLASVLGGGSIFHTHYLQGQADRYTDKIIDYTRCPSCHSNNISEIKDGEVVQANSTPISITSATDELKKYKELLDSGVISQEEFDAKKKQLLGL